MGAFAVPLGYWVGKKNMTRDNEMCVLEHWYFMGADEIFIMAPFC